MKLARGAIRWVIAETRCLQGFRIQFSRRRVEGDGSYQPADVLMGYKAMRKIMTLALLLVLAVPAPAWAAARVIAPPGNSEADQYFETLPGPTGPRAPASTREAREGALAEATERTLLRQGATGEALAIAVARTAPNREAGGGSPRPAPLPASAVRIPGEKGLGGLFPLVLVATAAAAFAFALSHRRRSSRR
jgi:hypothetical protein